MSHNCQTVNNISVATSGLLTGSTNYKCTADTWILSAERGQHIELIVRDYTSYDVATSASDDNPPPPPAAAAAAADDDDDDDAASDRKSR